MALATSTILGGVASIAGGAMQAGAANRAAEAQTAAAEKQLALQREMYDTTRNDLSGYRDAGNNALAAYQYELGLGNAPMIGGNALPIETIAGTPAQNGLQNWNILDQLRNGGGGVQQTAATPDTYRVGGQTFSTMADAQAYANANRTGGTQYQGISLSPAAQFAMQQGFDGIQASAAARGGLRSGSAMQALENTRFGLAAQDRESQLNRLGGLTDMGMSAASMNAANNNSMANMGSNAFANMGNAQSAGYIGAGNAWGNAFGNLAGVWGYQKAQA